MDIVIERHFMGFKGNDAFLKMKVEYQFFLMDRMPTPEIYLEGIRFYERESTRHKWKLKRIVYSRLKPDRSAPGYESIVTESDALAQVPNEVKNEAVEKIRSRIELKLSKSPSTSTRSPSWSWSQ